jgi:hypothetical protein
VALKGIYDEVTKSAGTRRNPRKHARTRTEKGQPRAVGLVELVEECGIKQKSACAFFMPNTVLHGNAQSCNMQRARPI